MRACTGFTLWARERDLQLDVEHLYTEENVEHYAATGLRHLDPHSQASYRSSLRRIGRAITTSVPWPAPPRPLPRKTLGAPYSDREIAWLQEIAATQTNEVRRRAATAVWCLSYGAGLRGPEFAAVTGRDVVAIGGATVVNVPGAKARQVPVLPDTAADLIALADRYPDRPLFSDRSPARGWTASVLGLIELPPGAPHFSSRRLRVTWMVKLCMAGIRISELGMLAAVSTSRGWDDLASHVPARDLAELCQLIGGRA